MVDHSHASTDAPTALTPELLKLMEHEKPLEDATASKADIWFALDRIREQELYRAAGYDNFLAYLQRHWGPGE